MYWLTGYTTSLAAQEQPGLTSRAFATRGGLDGVQTSPAPYRSGAVHFQDAFMTALDTQEKRAGPIHGQGTGPSSPPP